MTNTISKLLGRSGADDPELYLWAECGGEKVGAEVASGQTFAAFR